LFNDTSKTAKIIWFLLVLEWAMDVLYGQMHHSHAQMTHDQNSKPELLLRDVIIIMNKDVYIERMSGT